MRRFSFGSLTFGVALLAWFAGNASTQDFKLEEGFKLLFNGKNLDGWRTKSGKESLEGKTEAFKGRFAVKEESIVIDPKVKGDVVIETAKELQGDLHIKFEFKPGKGCNNDLFLRGIKFDLVPGKVKSIKEDEWNEFEIVATGTEVVHKCNGKVERTTKVNSDSSTFGIRAEFGPVEIRRLRIKAGS